MTEIAIERFNVTAKYLHRSSSSLDKLTSRPMKFDLKSNNFYHLTSVGVP